MPQTQSPQSSLNIQSASQIRGIRTLPSRGLATTLLPVLLWLAAGCASGNPARSAPTPPVDTSPPTEEVVLAEPVTEGSQRRVTVLAINDIYRIEGVDAGTRGGMARLRTLRAQLEADRGHPVLVLHAGDLLYPSLLSRMFDGAQMVGAMNHLDGDPAAFDPHLFVTLGNHEFDPGDLDEAPLLDQRIEESAFYWFGTGIEFVTGEDGLPAVEAHNLLHHRLVTIGEGSAAVTVGLFGITLDTAGTEYVTSFGDPLEIARRQVAALRRAGADVVIALTHLNARQDADLLRALPGADGPDVVIGGHDHQAMEIPVDHRWVLKSDAEAVTARVIDLYLPEAHAAREGASDPDGYIPPRVAQELVEVDSTIPADPGVSARVAHWLAFHESRYCADLKPPQPDGCLETVVGHTRTRLVASEAEIRGYETNLGDWIADRALAAFDDASLAATADAALPRVAFLNSGSLRLNQDIPPGPIRVRELEELFAYPTPLVMLKIDGATLRRVLERSIRDWPGGGWWLQVAGLAYRHDPQAGTVSDITLLHTPDGPRPLRDTDTVLAITGTYLVDPSIGDQDGYTMLDETQVVARDRNLRTEVEKALAAAEPQGIAPRVDGRICNPVRPDLPCLAKDNRR